MSRPPNPTSGSTAPRGAVPPPTHGATVLGWLIICFAVIPLAMAGSGDGASWGLAGLVMGACGAGLVVWGRSASRRSRSEG